MDSNNSSLTLGKNKVYPIYPADMDVTIDVKSVQLGKFLKLSEQDKANFKTADEAEAVVHILHNTVRSQEGDELPLSVDISYFKRYGLGLFLYFQLVRRLAILFFVFSVCYIPSLVSNFAGNGLQNYGQMRSIFMMLTLANQNQLVYLADNTTAANQALNAEKKTAFVLNASQNYWLVAVPDLVCVILFILFYVNWVGFVKKTKEDYLKLYPTPSRFCCVVEGLPRAGTKESDVWRHFSKMGDLVEVKPCRNYQNVLSKFQSVAERSSQVKKNLRRVQLAEEEGSPLVQRLMNSIEAQKEEMVAQILQAQEIIKTHAMANNEFELLHYYVVFKDTMSKARVLQQYGKYTNFSCLERSLCCCCLPRMPGDMCFMGEPVEVRKCKMEPEGIKWENQGISGTESCCRGLLMWTLIILTLAVAFVAIFFVSLLTPKITTGSNVNYTPTFEQANVSGNSSIVDLYCYSLSLSAFAETNILTLCADSLKRYALQWVLNTSIGIAIVVINTVLVVLVGFFSNLKRFKSNGDEIRTKALSLYIATLINSVILTVFLQSDFWGTSPTRLSVDLLKTTSISNAINPLLLYSDFDRGWYIDVGTKITTFWIVAVFSPHLINLLLLPLIRCWRQRKALQAEFQVDLNRLSLGPEFQIGNLYADLLHFITVSFIFSSAIPHMMLLGTVGLVLKYWCYKYFILRFNKRPATLDHQIIKLTYTVIPATIVLHLLISVWAFGCQSIFPLESSPIYSILKGLVSSSGAVSGLLSNVSVNEILTRLLFNIYFTALLALILGYYLVKLVLVQFLGFLISLLCGVKGEETAPTVRGMHFDKVKDVIETKMLTTYDIKKNPEYGDLVSAIEAVSSSVS